MLQGINAPGIINTHAYQHGCVMQMFSGGLKQRWVEP